MEKIVNRLINESLVNVDRYNNGGSTWLIFTETKQWVIELTKEGTLWYNYNYFKNLFNYLGVDVVENQHYITKWVEDTIQNGVKDTIEYDVASNPEVEDTIQNGVKDTLLQLHWWVQPVEDTIQNGVKDTFNSPNLLYKQVEDTIQNGVKDTASDSNAYSDVVEDTIINGVKGTNFSPTFTEYGDWLDGDERLDEIIQNGVKHTPNISLQLVKGYGVANQVENTIKNGVKETKGINGVHGMNVAIQNGVKETNHVDVMKFFNNKMEDTLQDGVKYVGGIGNPKWVGKKVEDTIQNGVKETKLGAPDNRDYFIEDAIQNGVKHTEPGGYLGSIEMKGKIVHQLESPKQNEEVEDVIENGVKYTVCSSAPFVYGVKDTLQHGVKETFDETHHRRREVVRTIRDGIKETYDDAYHHKSRVDGVIKNGIKQTCAQIPSVQPVVERILEEGILQTKPMDEWVNTNRIVDKVMTESIKETLWMNGDSTNWGLEDDDLLEGHDKIEDTINNGIKEVKELPDQSGELRGYGDYYHRQEDRTKPFNEYLNDVIENGIKI